MTIQRCPECDEEVEEPEVGVIKSNSIPPADPAYYAICPFCDHFCGMNCTHTKDDRLKLPE